ncbi:folate-binding protein YgfZ [Chitinimonas sp.]|uniref:CAF17-like 4Fe-4S cluster assembly/insertion protein YgfZ n=1 Tax=Chitinimonas sp. TaxID=1934313 RepID=UPI0035B261CA
MESTSWLAFLKTQGARIDEAGLAQFDGGAEADVALTPLLQFGLLRFSGEDTESFLHGQLSSDIKNLPVQAAQYSSYSTPKGRMLASMLVQKREQDIVLQLPGDLLAAVQKRLSMYVLRSKTRAENVSDTLVQLGLSGPNALALLQGMLALDEIAPLTLHPLDGGWLSRLPGDRVLLVLDSEAAPSWWSRLVAAGAVAASASTWTLSDIRAGIPWVQAQTQEAFVPQMANMDLIGAVSFKKGCYPGQEIVARTHYLGKLKRRTYRIRADEQLQIGQSLYSPEMNGQPSGEIAMVAPAGAGWEALAVIQTSSIEHGLHLHDAQGALVELLDLPYPLPAA